MAQAFETNDAGYVAHALGVVARAKGMAQIAGQTGLSREQLYRSFSENGNPTLKTTLAVMKALGIELTAKVLVACRGCEFASPTKQLAMRTRPNKVDLRSLHLINQQKIPTNVAFAMVSPLPFERMVEPLRAKRRVICDQQQHRFLKPTHVIAT